MGLENANLRKLTTCDDDDIHDIRLHDDHDASTNDRSPNMSQQKRYFITTANSEATNAHVQHPCRKKLKRGEDPVAVTPIFEFEHSPSGFSLPCHIKTQLVRPHHVPEPTVLSPLDVANASVIRQHIEDIRRELFLRPLVMIVSRLMFHRFNHGFFNVRVDPIAYNIPHYFEVVKNPMDLSLVKKKCLDLEYASIETCVADINLVFDNACLFNPPGHMVHEAAVLMKKEFDVEYTRFLVKRATLEKKKHEHSCPSCLANVCGICAEKCINFEPPLVMCAGTCNQRIRRHAIYYKTPNRALNWCLKCYTALPRLIPTRNTGTTPVPNTGITMEEGKLLKQSLIKAKFLDELTEPWVQCDDCNGWVHQICALFNAFENTGADGAEGKEEADVPFTCPLCKLKKLERASSSVLDTEIATEEVSRNMLGMSPRETTSVEEFPLRSSRHEKFELMGSHSPVLKQKQPLPKDYTRVLGFDGIVGVSCGGETRREKVMKEIREENHQTVEADDGVDHAIIEKKGVVTSESLRSCAMASFMQEWVRHKLETLGEVEAAHSIVIKVVSSVKSTCVVSPVVRQHFQTATREYPEAIEYTSKAIFVFQQIHGVEVCIFSMYVQEYDKNSALASNRNRVYIAYLDSLVYMRPRHVRTTLFHEILISYLAFAKRRGYEFAHLWACPTTRGGDFIYWCHPNVQKNPDKDRLVQWYSTMTKKAQEARVAYTCEDLYTREFQTLEETMEAKDHLPPYFDGDYWPAEVERIAAHPPKRGKLTKEAYAESLRGRKFRKRVVDSVFVSKESLFVIALQPECVRCHQLMVNTSYWMVCGLEEEEVVCCQCMESTRQGLKKTTTVERVFPPSFSTEEEDNEEEQMEISCPFVNHRPDMLKHCVEYHYQYDTFRRAKYSTMMLVYQIHSTQTLVPRPSTSSCSTSS